MKNYHYIVASLPDIAGGWKSGEQTAGAIISEIRERCDSHDRRLIDIILESFKAESLTEEFYREALSSGNSFIREYFTFDLNVRNAKVRYLNKALGRPADKDIIDIRTGEFEKAAEVEQIFLGNDIIAREKAIDDLYWEKLDELSMMHYFDMNVIMAFILKLRIIDRWHTLDENTGREMFKKLVDEVRSTFKGVEYEI
ncbi:MAG: DUF2764 domain-containing protein [Bacteroidales bacterium]|nr:DUF2764 domain-containing protein [Bacteroidales bacterium]